MSSTEIQGAPNYLAIVQSGIENRYDVLLGAFTSGRQAWILKNVEGVGEVGLVDGAVALILLQGGKTYFRIYDPEDFRLRRSTELRI